MLSMLPNYYQHFLIFPVFDVNTPLTGMIIIWYYVFTLCHPSRQGPSPTVFSIPCFHYWYSAH